MEKRRKRNSRKVGRESGGVGEWRGGRKEEIGGMYHPLLAVSLQLPNSSHSAVKQDNTIQCRHH